MSVPVPRFRVVRNVTLLPSTAAAWIGRPSRAPSITVPDNVVPSSFNSIVIGCAMPFPSAAESWPVHLPATPVCAKPDGAAATIKPKTKSDSESFTFIFFSPLLLSSYHPLGEQCIPVKWGTESDFAGILGHLSGYPK
jgi:hypothetical protein